MKHLALAAALSVAMPVQSSWWDDMGQCSDAVSDATRRYQVAREQLDKLNKENSLHE